jgi:glycosyltransferase involved in cell wall biosynthesis
MKILLVPDRYAHYRRGVFEELSKNFEVKLLANFEKDHSGIEVANESEYYKKGSNWFSLKDIFIRNICFWQIGLISHIYKSDFNVLIIWGDMWRITTWLGVILARHKGKKIIFWTHGLYGNENYFRKRLRVMFYKLGHRTFTYGVLGRSLLLDEGFSCERVINVANSISNSASLISMSKSSLSDLDKLANERVELCFIGRLEQGKSLDLLIQALKLLLSGKQQDIFLHLVGDGPQKLTLESYARELGVDDKVIFHGAIYDEKTLVDAISNCCMCISPGNVGLTAITALSLGIPVITHNDPYTQMPEYEAVISGLNGWLFCPNELGDLYESITKVLDGIMVGDITRESCYRVVENTFSPEAQVQKIKEFIGANLDF